MRVTRDNDAVLLDFNPLEGRVLLQVFQHLAAMYRFKPGELDGAIAKAWYSTRGCESARATPEETREWVEHLHAFKTARLGSIEEWSRQLAAAGPAGAGRPQIRVRLDDAPAFIASINDHRLSAAAQHDVGEEEMALRMPMELAALPEERQQALLEIHFLAWIIEETLREIQDP
jgi:hypothetical protein